MSKPYGLSISIIGLTGGLVALIGGSIGGSTWLTTFGAFLCGWHLGGSGETIGESQEGGCE